MLACWKSSRYNGRLYPKQRLILWSDRGDGRKKLTQKNIPPPGKLNTGLGGVVAIGDASSIPSWFVSPTPNAKDILLTSRKSSGRSKEKYLSENLVVLLSPIDWSVDNMGTRNAVVAKRTWSNRTMPNILRICVNLLWCNFITSRVYCGIIVLLFHDKCTMLRPAVRTFWGWNVKRVHFQQSSWQG